MLGRTQVRVEYGSACILYHLQVVPNQSNLGH